MQTGLIDGFTVIAQIINFLILLYLLQRFLYRPITRVMDDRQHRMASRWQEARDKQKQAEEEAAAYRRQQRQLDDRRSQLMQQAEAKADERRRDMVAQARQEVDEMRDQWQDALRRQQHDFLAHLRRQIAQRTYDLTRQTLRQVVDGDLEERAIHAFIQRLQHLDAEDRRLMREAIEAGREPVLIRSGFELSEGDRQRLLEQVQRQLADQKELVPVAPEDAEVGDAAAPDEEPELPAAEDLEEHQVPVRFLTSPRLICGVAVQASGQEVGWSMHHYLQGVEAEFADLIRREVERGQGSAVEPTAGDRTVETLRHQLARQTYAIARQALTDLADADLERRTVAVFLQRLRRIDEAERQALAQRAASLEQIPVRSSFALSPDQQDQIAQGLTEVQIASNPTLQVEQTDSLICGIELQLGDRSLAWSLDHYLRSLDDHLETAAKEMD